MMALGQLLALAACVIALVTVIALRASREGVEREVARLPPALQVVALEAVVLAPGPCRSP